MLASADQVAIDAVAAKMMGFDPMSHRVHPAGARGRPRRRRSARHRDRRRRRRGERELGLPRRRELVRVGGGDLIWFGPLKRFQKLFFHTPLVNVFILGQRGLPRLLPLAAGRPPRVRALVRDDRVGPDVPALRADGPAGRRAGAVVPPRRNHRSRLDPNPLDSSRSAKAFALQTQCCQRVLAATPSASRRWSATASAERQRKESV